MPDRRCPSRAPKEPLPGGLPVETARHHPRWRYALESGGQCNLETGHDGPHRAGGPDWGLVWHDPQLLLVGGEPFTPPPETP